MKGLCYLSGTLVFSVWRLLAGNNRFTFCRAAQCVHAHLPSMLHESSVEADRPVCPMFRRDVYIGQAGRCLGVGSWIVDVLGREMSMQHAAFFPLQRLGQRKAKLSEACFVEDRLLLVGASLAGVSATPLLTIVWSARLEMGPCLVLGSTRNSHACAL